MKCEYCGEDWIENKHHGCSNCGAPKPRYMKSEPFSFEDLIVYGLFDFMRNGREYVFYRGTNLVGKVFVSYEEMIRMTPGEDITPYVYSKLLAQVQS